jgi:hypothetical protein
VRALAHAGRWVFTAVFGGALALVFGLAVFATAVFCIVGALVQGCWRNLAGRR